MPSLVGKDAELLGIGACHDGNGVLQEGFGPRHHRDDVGLEDAALVLRHKNQADVLIAPFAIDRERALRDFVRFLSFAFRGSELFGSLIKLGSQ